MICLLPGWMGQALTILSLAIALGGGLFAFHALAGIGARKHPRMDFTDAGHRRWWECGGIALGLAAFVVLLMLVGTVGRSIACDLAGTYSPIHSLP